MDGDAHCQKVMMRYSNLISIKREKTKYKRLMYKEMVSGMFIYPTVLEIITCSNQDEAIARRNQPIYTGSFIRPTFYNVPLPRMKPQPMATSMIYLKRRTARQRRYDKKEELQEYLHDLQIEQQLEEDLVRHVPFEFPRVFSGYPASQGWSMSDFFDGLFIITDILLQENLFTTQSKLSTRHRPASTKGQL